MKKVTTALLATALTVSVTGQVSAEEIKEPTPIVQNVEVSGIWKTIASFKATVFLEDEKYKVNYDNKDGIVNVNIKKETGKEEIEVTGEEANERVIEFVKDLDLSRDLSKEEVINRLSSALGVEPSEVEKVDAAVTFTNEAKASFSYKQGEKSEVADPFDLRQLQVKLEANDGSFYNIHFHVTGNDDIKAMVKKQTEDGEEKLKGLDALNEINRIKDGLIPGNDSTWNEYVEQVSDVLGVEVTDITKADVRVQLADHTKVDFNFNR